MAGLYDKVLDVNLKGPFRRASVTWFTWSYKGDMPAHGRGRGRLV